MIIINQVQWVIFKITIILNMKERVIEIKKLLVKEYLDKIKTYLRDISNN